jgi:hypothetical protein
MILYAMNRSTVTRNATALFAWLGVLKTLSQRGRFAFWQYECSVSTPILALLPSVQLYLAEFRMLSKQKKKKGKSLH